MLKAISYKTKQFLLVLIKLGLVVAAFYFIYHKLFQNNTLHFEEFTQTLSNSGSISVHTIIILLILSVLNWLFEILKWQTLVKGTSELSFAQAKAQTLGALTASLITPNRIGDYGAKAMYYQPQLRKKIVLLNLIGNSAQMGVTTLFGIIGFAYFILRFQPTLNYVGVFTWFAIIGMITVTLMLLLKMSGLKNQKTSLYRQLAFIKDTTKKSVFNIVLYALIRYLIFSFQFYYLLLLFGVEMNYLDAMAGISSMYLLSSIIPSIVIFDVIIKGGIAVYLFGLIGVSESIMLSIVTFMWVLNFVLPSIIGSYHVLHFKLPKIVS